MANFFTDNLLLMFQIVFDINGHHEVLLNTIHDILYVNHKKYMHIECPNLQIAMKHHETTFVFVLTI